MKKFKLALKSLGFVFTNFLAAFAASSNSNVQNEPIPGGVDIVGEGGTVTIIQGDDNQDLPAPMPAVTPPLESHFSAPPPPQIFTPPSPPQPSPEK
jgi:hypothetical protein